LIVERRVNGEEFNPDYRRMLTVSHSHALTLAEFAYVIVVNHRFRVTLNGNDRRWVVGRVDRQP
jgi:hypothetical protein